MRAALALGGLVVVGIGGAWLVWRAREAASRGGSFCAETLQPLGRAVKFDVPPSWCSAVDGLGGLLGGLGSALGDLADGVRIGGTLVPFLEDKWKQPCPAGTIKVGATYRGDKLNHQQSGMDAIDAATQVPVCVPPDGVPSVSTAPTVSTAHTATPDPSTWPPGYRWAGTHWERV